MLHLISSTQGWRPLIKPEFHDDLFAHLGGIIQEMQAAAVIVNGTADHVHMLVRIRLPILLRKIAPVVKANSCKWVRSNWSSEFAWQTG